MSPVLTATLTCRSTFRQKGIATATPSSTSRSIESPPFSVSSSSSNSRSTSGVCDPQAESSIERSVAPPLGTVCHEGFPDRAIEVRVSAGRPAMPRTWYEVSRAAVR